MTCLKCQKRVGADILGHDCDSLLELLCIDHFLALKKARAKGKCLRCDNAGALYPGGRFCSDHAPKTPIRPPAVHESRAVTADVVQDHVFEVTLEAMVCPDGLMPSTVKSAVKKALANDWDTRVTYAIADDVESVVFRAHRADICVASRHEKQAGKPQGFRAAWWQQGNKLPVRIGWRELTAALSGTDPNQTDLDELRAAVLTVMDIGGIVERMETTG